MRVVERRLYVYVSFFSNLIFVLIKDEYGNVEESVVFLVNLKCFDNVFLNIVRGIFFYCFGEKWFLGIKVILNVLMDVILNNVFKVNEEI